MAVEGLSERELVGWSQGWLDGPYGRVPELPFLHPLKELARGEPGLPN